jgi:hypothetical protein
VPPSQSTRGLLVRIDSVTSLVAARHSTALPADVHQELLAVSGECRRLSDRDALAVAVAERWWPDRYVGDLTGPEWDRVYGAVDGDA